MNEITNIFDDMFSLTDMFSHNLFNEKPVIGNTGLKRIIGRPHNLINIKDDAGNVIALKLEVVTTPFKSADVSVELKNNILTVTCGKTEEVASDAALTEDVLYRGISQQSYHFSLTVSPTVDKSKITAKNADGMLTITLPFMKKEEPETIKISID